MGGPGRTPKKPKSRFSKRLIALRNACGLSQVELADAMGVNRAMVCYWECIADNPRFHTLEQLAAFFHVTPGYFLDETAEDDAGDVDLKVLFKKIRKLSPDKQKLVNEFVGIDSTEDGE